jgi:phage terminase large subunit-like protein
VTDPPCPDCGWSPVPGQLWPTEGPLACRWIETQLVLGEGDWYGQPVRLRPDQKRFIWRWYEYCGGCGYWRYDEAVRGAATGDGKTTLVAAIQCLEMGGPPQIAPLSPNVVNAAASFEQADLLFGVAGTMLGGRDQVVAAAPLCGYFEVYDTEIRFADAGRPGVMKRVAAVAGTNEGGLPSLFVCDEVHEWGELGSGKARVHMVIGKSTKKRRLQCQIPGKGTVSRGPGRILNISTAGFDVDNSLLGAMYLHGKRALDDPSLAPRLLFDWHEAPDGLDYADPAQRRTAVQAASEAAGVLWDVEARVREWDKPEVQSHEWIRYYANRWVDVAEESWLADHPAAWGQCEGAWEILGDEPTVLVIDMSLKHDSTAVDELAMLADGRIAVTARIWNPGDGKVDHAEVERHVLDRAHDLGGRLAGVVYDPRFLELLARKLEESLDCPVIEFDQWVMMTKATGATFDRIVKGRIVHDGNKELSRHVRSAVRKQQERGFTLSKNKSRWKIDGCVAMCMGVWTLEQLVTDIEGTIW